ncbi:ubiquinol-cytochrome c reductase iron-sulfur subunit [Geobacter sp. AOG1]|uniref:QcrA and Rieske domain-containing protein n=1 Tax=Geobacter sp. AOG1 TaxID=1566346 RepID=UPI001CC4D694|nr:ubiquinol-cytochrome c reductase iron-sulfur subunit [Geobacter sp. AOG1]GFE58521.1 cytochrome b6 [Geobacter sp. AOG1]
MDARSRRRFLGICLGGVLAGAGATVLYPLVSYLAPRRGSGGGSKVTIPAADVPEGAAKFFEYNGKTAVVIRQKNGALVALSAVCTHLGCVVQWQKEKEEFLCPCHGGRFNAAGLVLGGPPPKPLESIPVAAVNGIITVG